MTTKSMGEDGFRWFVGVVEDREDPKQLGRVRVRPYNFSGDNVHTQTSDLHWATPMMPVTSAGLGFVGVSPTGIRVGSTVIGFYMDGNEMQIPVIMGTVAGITDNNHDVTPLARGQQSLNKTRVGPEPESAYRGVFPFNKVMQSESGHVIEVDDTPNAERLHMYHRTGTYTEINELGERVNKIVSNDFEIVEKNQTVYINGNVNVQVNGNYTLNVDGDVVINGRTVNINHGTNGAARIGDTADTGDQGTGSSTDDNAAGTNIIETGSGTVFIGD